MNQNVIASKIKKRAHLTVRHLASSSSFKDRVVSSSSHHNSTIPLSDGGGEIKTKKTYITSVTLVSCIIEFKETEISDHGCTTSTSCDEDFDNLYLLAVKRKKELDDEENEHINEFRKTNTLSDVLLELPNFYRYHILTYEKMLVSSFLWSYVKQMKKKTRHAVMERIRKYEVDPTLFDLNSFQKLLYQINHLISFLDEHNEEETYYSILRLFKRNLYRFWFRIGINYKHNLDYHWDLALNFMCKLKEDEESLFELLDQTVKKKIDEGKSQFDEEVEKFKIKNPPPVTKHSCGFSQLPNVSDYHEVLKYNQNILSFFSPTLKRTTRANKTTEEKKIGI